MLEKNFSEFDPPFSMGQPGEGFQPFVIDLPKQVTAGILMEILSRVPLSAEILCDFNTLDSKSFPITCMRYDGKRLIEITVGD